MRYGSSKLSEMLALPEEVREVVPRDATVGKSGGVKKSSGKQRRSLFAADEPVRHRTRRTPWKLDGKR